MKLPKQKLVVIEWEDSCEIGGWAPMKKVKEELKNVNTCHSVGWVIDENAERILISPHLSYDEGTGSMIIPKRIIKSMKRIKI